MSQDSGVSPSSGGPEAQVYCIAGLGNPGVRYQQTPHNVGFWVADELGKRWGIRVSKNESETLTGSGKIRNKDVILVKPQTFMNHSGVGISAVLRYRKLTYQNLIVVYDELDLPWTALRIKVSGSAAGQRRTFRPGPF